VVYCVTGMDKDECDHARDHWVQYGREWCVHSTGGATLWCTR